MKSQLTLILGLWAMSGLIVACNGSGSGAKKSPPNQIEVAEAETDAGGRWTQIALDKMLSEQVHFLKVKNSGDLDSMKVVLGRYFDQSDQLEANLDTFAKLGNNFSTNRGMNECHFSKNTEIDGLQTGSHKTKTIKGFGRHPLFDETLCEDIQLTITEQIEGRLFELVFSGLHPQIKLKAFHLDEDRKILSRVHNEETASEDTRKLVEYLNDRVVRIQVTKIITPDSSEKIWEDILVENARFSTAKELRTLEDLENIDFEFERDFLASLNPFSILKHVQVIKLDVTQLRDDSMTSHLLTSNKVSLEGVTQSSEGFSVNLVSLENENSDSQNETK